MILLVAKVLKRATNLTHFAHQSLATLKTKLAVVLTVTVPLSVRQVFSRAEKNVLLRARHKLFRNVQIALNKLFI
ncbi:hypothetical protein HID58_005509 [Brassica napus]|uniref:HAT C-terminal dimerisation domain-containing protein n=1 Tax=Brassica napus TaxID=3708 RepID=A0ABQ8EB59_BRANA|nr:hypothetical protein HID58_005509 [Brassica napus]